MIGKACKDVPEEEALSYVLGYTCCNDVSAREWQFRAGAYDAALGLRGMRHLSVCLSVCLSVYLSVCLSRHLL